MRFMKYLMGSMLLMDKAGGEGGGGSGGEGDKGKGDSSKDIADLRDQNAKLLARLDALEKKGKGKNDDDEGDEDDDEEDLNSKATKQRQEKEKRSSDSKALESALSFTIASKDWLKTNASLLPKDVEGIFAASEKESYDDAVQKASSIKSAIIQSFFKVQENLDLLTAHQKSILEDWLKLTKNGKEEKAQSMYDSIFEPTFEALKRVKKAAQLNKAGERSGDDAENAYKDKLIKGSRKHYMGEK